MMDTEEELVVQIANHDIRFRMSKSTRRQVPASGTSPACKQWRFGAFLRALFADSDGSLKWLRLSWAEANQQAVLERYAEIHPESELNIPEN
jgi:hypothetical protein